MVGILIVTHGKLAEGFLSSVEMIMGEQEQFATLGLFPNSDLENFKELVLEKIRQMDTGDGVIVFVDLFGASTCNFAAANIMELIEEDRQIRIITGVNLGMVIESVSMRTFVESFSELYQKILTTGKDGIRELLETISSQEDEDE